MDEGKIRVLIVDDSRVTRDLIKHLLGINPHIEIVGAAADGFEALELIKKTSPDVVFTDIVMPKMNGFELTKKIMETHPLPVIVMSGVYSAEEIRRGFNAIDAGAIAIMEKPKGIADEEFADTAKFVFETSRLISTIRGFNKSSPTGSDSSHRKLPGAIQKRLDQKDDPYQRIKALAIGSSIGGPKALQSLLSPLSMTTKIPIFIVQHIMVGFVNGFVEWLKDNISLNVKLATHNEMALPGHVYIAPDKHHMEVDRQGCIFLTEEKEGDVYTPSISRLFQSFADSYGSNAMGVLLVGAEKDGLKGLGQIERKDGLAIMENSSLGKKEAGANACASIEEITVFLKALA